ncbi:ATP-dependent RNA helicase Dbp73D isoform 1 [Capsicum annuum]|nr:ATP-dependent RNA helicase Dbp73D isoform 1 [Capsicum annuum]KAF3681289.1 ATP-dependent RNA helicase Dbp73D isoform 1 [Capsicum annuum]
MMATTQVETHDPTMKQNTNNHSSFTSVYSTDIGLGHGKLDKSHVQEMHQRWQWRSWMNHGSFRGARKHLVNPTVEHNPFDVPKLTV